jgi:hypothetical protein
MARGRKKKERVERTVRMKASELRKAMEESTRLRDQQSSYGGFLGNHVKNFTERTGYSRPAFAFIAKLHRLGDDMKRQQLIREVLMGVELMGWSDQGDLFDNIQSHIDEHAERDSGEEEDGEPDPAEAEAAQVEANVTALKRGIRTPAPRKPDSLSALTSSDMRADDEDAPTSHPSLN